jgi:3'-phosphoadenosine 5'-phosphosulfate sulfotransferase (PAPS reductase)/FAD synthetase
MEKWQLQQMQQLPLELKILKSQQRIREWYEYYGGNVYVSFSGGKDSTVLLRLVRELYPEVPAVFIDTGLEYPEIKEFVKTIPNVITLRPKMSFVEVIEKYGYPVVSKEQSGYIQQWCVAKSEKTKDTRWNGNKWGQGKISEKWKYLVDAPFKISDECCGIMKKNPAKIYEKETKRHPMVGVMAAESSQRQRLYLQHGCNAFDMKRPKSEPLGFWTEQDVLQYLVEYNVPYASVYGEIVDTDGVLKCSGEQRTGCMFCMFGAHLEKGENKFQRMSRTHPKIYDYCINKLGLGVVLDYIKVPY